jgi:hypothetical protein
MGEPFEQWCIVEIMGHKQLAGRVSEQVVAGKGFVRVDVPAVGDLQEFTKIVGPDSIYCLTPVSEKVAKLFAEKLRERPVSTWDLPAPARAAIESLSCGGYPKDGDHYFNAGAEDEVDSDDDPGF